MHNSQIHRTGQPASQAPSNEQKGKSVEPKSKPNTPTISAISPLPNEIEVIQTKFKSPCFPLTVFTDHIFHSLLQRTVNWSGDIEASRALKNLLSFASTSKLFSGFVSQYLVSNSIFHSIVIYLLSADSTKFSHALSFLLRIAKVETKLLNESSNKQTKPIVSIITDCLLKKYPLLNIQSVALMQNLDIKLFCNALSLIKNLLKDNLVILNDQLDEECRKAIVNCGNLHNLLPLSRFFLQLDDSIARRLINLSKSCGLAFRKLYVNTFSMLFENWSLGEVLANTVGFLENSEDDVVLDALALIKSMYRANHLNDLPEELNVSLKKNLLSCLQHSQALIVFNALDLLFDFYDLDPKLLLNCLSLVNNRLKESLKLNSLDSKTIEQISTVLNKLHTSNKTINVKDRAKSLLNDITRISKVSSTPTQTTDHAQSPTPQPST